MALDGFDGSVTLQLYGTAPSQNTTTGGHWAKVRRIKKQWQTDLAKAMMVAHLPKRCAYIRADALLTFGVNRRRDTDNHTTWLAKSLGDALQDYGAIDDDTPEHFLFGTLEMRVEKGAKPSTWVVLRYRLKAPA